MLFTLPHVRVRTGTIEQSAPRVPRQKAQLPLPAPGAVISWSPPKAPFTRRTSTEFSTRQAAPWQPAHSGTFTVRLCENTSRTAW